MLDADWCLRSDVMPESRLQDYWTATLWTWMVGPTVLSASVAQATAEPAGETDEEFLARMEAEDAASFQEALMEWRTDKAAGGGQATTSPTSRGGSTPQSSGSKAAVSTFVSIATTASKGLAT